MLNKLRKLITFILPVFLIACFNKEPPKLNLNDKIVAVGDSLTVGYGSTLSYTKNLEQISGYSILNKGFNGAKTEDIVRDLPDILEDKPKLVLLSIGGNDMLRKIEDEKIKNNLEEIIVTLKESNIEVVLISQPRPSISGMIGVLNDADFYEEIADKHNVLLIENLFSKYLSKKEYKSDLIHLNDKGYKEFSKDLYIQLKKENILS